MSKAITAVNTESLDANWQTDKYIVEYEQGGKQRAEYGKSLLVNLAKAFEMPYFTKLFGFKAFYN